MSGEVISVTLHGYEAEVVDACLRRLREERDTALAEVARLRRLLLKAKPDIKPLPVRGCSCYACEFLRRKHQKEAKP